MAVTFVAAGAIASDVTGAASFTPTPPTHQTDDILIAIALNVGNTQLSTITEGWTLIGEYTSGSVAGASWWKRAVGAGTAGPTITATTTDAFGIVYAYRGCVTSGTPYDTPPSMDGTGIAAGVNIPGNIQCGGSNRLAVAFALIDDDNAWGSSTPISNEPEQVGWELDNRTATGDGTDATFVAISRQINNSETVIGPNIGQLAVAEYKCYQRFCLIAEDQTPTVVLNTPADAAPLSITTPTLEFTGTDLGADPVEYEIQIDTSTNFNSGTGVGYSVKYVDAFLIKVGSPTDNLTMEIRSGSFTGTLLGTSNNVAASTLSSSINDKGTPIRFTFSSAVALTKATKYYMILKRSGARDTSNYIEWIYTSSDVTSSGAYATKASGSWGSENASGYDRTFTLWTSDLIAIINIIPFQSNVEVMYGATGTAEELGQTFTCPTQDRALIDRFSDTDAGFSNTTDAGDTHPFDSGDKADYDVQGGEALSSGNTYYWRVRAKEPNMTGFSYGPWSSTRSFSLTLQTVLNSPANASNVYPKPVLNFTGTDPAAGELEYQVQVVQAGGNPVYDTVSSAKMTTDTTYLAWNHTIGGGQDRIVVIGIAMRVATASSVTFNGVACTFLRRDKPGSDVNSEIWYILEASLPVAGTYEVRVNSLTTQRWMAGAISYSNVDSTLGNNNGSNGTSTNPTVTLTTVSGQVVIDVVSLQSAAASLTVDGSQAQRWNLLGTVGHGGGSTETATGTSTVMSWTIANNTWAISTVALKGKYVYSVNALSETDAGFYHDGSDTHPFTSAHAITYTVQTGSELTVGQTYSWRARCQSVGDVWSAWTSFWTMTVIEQIVLVVGDGSHAHTSDNIALTQHNILVVQDCTHVHTADTPTLTYHENAALVLTVQDSTHLQTSDDIALVQHNILAVDNSSQLHTSDVISLTPVLIVQNCSQLHTAGAIVLLDGELIITPNTSDDHEFGSDTTPTLEFTGISGLGKTLGYVIELNQDNASVTLADNYSVQDTQIIYLRYDPYTVYAGQSFTPLSTGNLHSCKFMLKKVGSPPGDYSLNAYVYEHNGTYGVDGTPGTQLAVSDFVSTSVLTTTPEWVTFTFPVGQRPELSYGTKYFVVVHYSHPDADGSNYVGVCGVDRSSVCDNHPGNYVKKNDWTAWSADNTSDLAFYVYNSVVGGWKDFLIKDSYYETEFVNTENGADTHPFTNNQKVSYTVQPADALDVGTYYWRAIAYVDTGSHNTAGNLACDWTEYRIFTISDHIVLQVSDCTHLQTCDNTTLVQHNVVTPSDCTHVLTSDSISLTQHNILVVDNSTQTLTSDDVVLTYHEQNAFVVYADDASHLQSSDNISLTPYNIYTLAVDDCQHLQSAGNIELVPSGLGVNIVMMVITNA